MAVAEYIDLPSAAVVRLDKGVGADLPCGGYRITSEFSACFNINYVGMNAVLRIFAGITEAAGLIRSAAFTQKQSCIIISHELFAAAFFAVKHNGMSRSVLFDHIAESSCKAFVSVNLFHISPISRRTAPAVISDNIIILPHLPLKFHTF